MNQQAEVHHLPVTEEGHDSADTADGMKRFARWWRDRRGVIDCGGEKSMPTTELEEISARNSFVAITRAVLCEVLRYAKRSSGAAPAPNVMRNRSVATLRGVRSSACHIRC